MSWTHSGLRTVRKIDMKIKWFEKLRQICFVYEKLCPFWKPFFEGAVWQGAANIWNWDFFSRSIWSPWYIQTLNICLIFVLCYSYQSSSFFVLIWVVILFLPYYVWNITRSIIQCWKPQMLHKKVGTTLGIFPDVFLEKYSNYFNFTYIPPNWQSSLWSKSYNS